MTKLLLAVARASVIALVGSAVGGGLLLALAANGIDLKQQVADGIRLVQSPDRLLAVTVVLSLVIGLSLLALLFAMVRFYQKQTRPPVEKVRALRAALMSTTEDVFDVMPDPVKATATISSLRSMAVELEPYKYISSKLWELVQLADDYTTIVMQRRDNEETANLHDDAIEQIQRLMRTTDWSVRH